MKELKTLLIEKKLDVMSVVREVSSIIGLPFERLASDEGELFRAELVGALVDIYDESDYSDDNDIEFSKYDVIVDFELRRSSKSVESASIRAKLFEGLVSLVASELSFELECDVVVVHELQIIEKRYRQGKNLIH